MLTLRDPVEHRGDLGAGGREKGFDATLRPTKRLLKGF
jgi:hypothetical protein